MNNSNNENNLNNNTNSFFSLNNDNENINNEIIIIDDFDVQDNQKNITNTTINENTNKQSMLSLDEIIKKNNINNVFDDKTKNLNNPITLSKELYDENNNLFFNENYDQYEKSLLTKPVENIESKEEIIIDKSDEVFFSDALKEEKQIILPIYSEKTTSNSNELNLNDNYNLPLTKNNNIFFSTDQELEKQPVTSLETEEKETDIQNNSYDIPIVENVITNSTKEEQTIDKTETNDEKQIKPKKSFFSKTIFVILLVLIFIVVSILVVKTFYFGNKIDHYEEFFTVIEEKEDDKVKLYENQTITEDNLKKASADELINCINSSLDMNNLPDSINSIINEINNYYNQSNNHFAFVYKDLFTGFTVTYNADQSIFAASSIKAPTDIYIWKMASQGKVNLDEMLTYTSSYYNTGSGVLKNNAFNTQYSVRKLLEYSTVTSDNAAHNMLMDKYGRENMLKFWQEKGTKTIFTEYTNWGPTSGHDAMIYMEELYNFYISDDEYGNAVMTNFINSYPKFLKGKNNYKVASKSGWSGSSLHEMAIIFADNPYIVIALSNLGDTGYYTSYFDTANDLAYKLHTEYWKYKINKCNEIKQY